VSERLFVPVYFHFGRHNPHIFQATLSDYRDMPVPQLTATGYHGRRSTLFTGEFAT
jgi:hypothetical protein